MWRKKKKKRKKGREFSGENKTKNKVPASFLRIPLLRLLREGEVCTGRELKHASLTSLRDGDTGQKV